MVNAKVIGTTIIANIGTPEIGFKLYSKDFPEIEERERVYQILLETNDKNYNDINKAKSLFAPEKSEAEIQLELEFEERKNKAKEFSDILDFMKDVRDNGHEIFEVVENSLYIEGIKLSIPELLIREIIKTLDKISSPEKYMDDDANVCEVYNIVDPAEDRLQALLNFWKLCALNPDPRARHDAFRFIENHKLTITSSGNFLTYRRAWLKDEVDTELEKFVTQEWFKIKRWKKAPKNYFVYRNFNDEYITTNRIVDDGLDHILGDLSDKLIGNLDELYQNLMTSDKKSVYTDDRTRTFNIQLGVPMVEDRGRVDPDPNVECSRGIHSGSPEYVNTNRYLGDTILACLVNPKDITAVPNVDSHKMRACKILPFAIAEVDENGRIIEPEYDTFDLEMAQNTQEELEAMSRLSSTALEEYKRHEFIAPEVDFNMVNNILESVSISIEEANEKIKNRVVKI